MTSIRRPTYTARDGTTKTSSRWQVRVYVLGVRRELPAYRDKSASAELGRRIERLAALRQSGSALPGEMADWLDRLPQDVLARFAAWGLVDEDRVSATQGLGDHLDAFEEALLAADAAPNRPEARAKHARTQSQRARAVLQAAGALAWGDVRLPAVERALASLRASHGWSTGTRDAYAQAVRQFGRWMVQQGRAPASPLDRLRRVGRPSAGSSRASLDAGQLRALLVCAGAGPVRLGLQGWERALLYRVAVETGLRPGELRRLLPDDVRAGAPVTVRVAATSSKHRREDVLVLRDDLGANLLALAGTRRSGQALLRMPEETSLGLMIREDLADAGVLERGKPGGRVAPRNAAGQRIDFYSLRHTFVSLLAAAGTHPALLQRLARHQTAQLTLGVYAHVRREDEVAALAALPDFPRDLPPSPGPMETPGDECGSESGEVGAPSRTRTLDPLIKSQLPTPWGMVPIARDSWEGSVDPSFRADASHARLAPPLALRPDIARLLALASRLSASALADVIRHAEALGSRIESMP